MYSLVNNGYSFSDEDIKDNLLLEGFSEKSHEVIAANAFTFVMGLIKSKAKEQSGNAAHFANHLLTELKTRYGVE